MNWEQISETEWRAIVPGGWLVKVETQASTVRHDGYSAQGDFGWEWRTALAFVPDPNHEWDLKKEVVA